MTKAGVVLIVFFLTFSTCVAAVTRVATFENFTAGQAFKPSFTDPVSGINFRNSTNPTGGFVIDGSNHLFGGGHYLTAAGGPTDGFGSYFGFTADLPALAKTVTIDTIYLDFRSNVNLEAFNSAGSLIAQQSGPAGYDDSPFTLEIDSAQFDIKTIQMVVTVGGAGYDNLSITVLPEPALTCFVFAAAITLGWRRH